MDYICYCGKAYATRLTLSDDFKDTGAIPRNIGEDTATIPQFKPLTSMSDWEAGARNAIKVVYPRIQVYGCWFHFTKRIWAKTQKVGLSHGFKNNLHIQKFVKELMAIPFLPPSLIYPTYSLLQMPSLEDIEMIKLEEMKKYFKKRWLTQLIITRSSLFTMQILPQNTQQRVITQNSNL